MASIQEALLDELASVEAILDQTIPVHFDDPGASESAPSWSVSLDLRPHTASDAEKQYVALTLKLTFSRHYPDEAPKILILRPRGLSDSKLNSLQVQLQERSTEMLGDPVVYDLIDFCCEFLSENNVPSSVCSICLYDITDLDSFVKTHCFHYFHSLCLGKYTSNCIKAHDEFLRENPPIPGMNQEAERQLKLVCPVCREELQDVKLELWLKSPPPHLECEEDEKFVRTPDIRKLQADMQKLFLRQVEQGSIINANSSEKDIFVLGNVAPATSFNESVESLDSERRLENAVHQRGSLADSTSTKPYGNQANRGKANLPRPREERNLHWKPRARGQRNRFQGAGSSKSKELDNPPKEPNLEGGEPEVEESKGRRGHHRGHHRGRGRGRRGYQGKTVL